jgi:hypothetical protein
VGAAAEVADAPVRGDGDHFGTPARRPATVALDAWRDAIARVALQARILGAPGDDQRFI